MAWTRHNPNGLEDGMIVRKVSSPSKVFRVRGNPDAGGATFVALSKGERTVLNGNARNYRPETEAEALERTLGTDRTPPLGDDRAPDPSEAPDPSQAPDRNETEDNDEFLDDDLDDEELTEPDPEPVASKVGRSLRSIEPYQEPGIVELCDRMRDAVALLDDDTCSPADAAAIVRAAAELNWAVSNEK